MSKIHDNPFRPDYDNGAPEPSELDRLRALNAELIEALQAVVKADTDYQHAQSFLNSIVEQQMANEAFKRALEQARAAIAKAGAK